MKNSLKCVLSENVTTSVTYSETRLSSKFTTIKVETVKKHQHDIVYYIKYPESQYLEDYNGETSQRLPKRVLNHDGRDVKSHLVNHAIKKCHKYPKTEHIVFFALSFNIYSNRNRKAGDFITVSVFLSLNLFENFHFVQIVL